MVEDRILESILQKQSANLEACAKKLLDTATRTAASTTPP